MLKTSLPTQKTAWAAIALIAAGCCLVHAKSYTVPSKEASSIGQAMLKAKKGDTVWVEEGVYREQVYVNPGVALIAKSMFKAKIDGSGRDRVVNMGNHSTLSGFDVVNGSIGVYSEGAANAVTRCRIRNNLQTGIMAVGHLPRIQDNLIVYNRGSGIQGWDVRSTIATINHNTIAYNSNHGLSIGGNSDIVVENNILAHNQKIGVKIEPTVKITFRNNTFYGNTELVEALPANNFSCDPMFIAPQLLNFALSDSSQCIQRGTDNDNLGARSPYSE
jgi:hypothetical protein